MKPQRFVQSPFRRLQEEHLCRAFGLDSSRWGGVFDHETRRTVTEAADMGFSNVTCNPAAIHIDAEYCKGTEFGQPLMNSILTPGACHGCISIARPGFADRLTDRSRIFKAFVWRGD